MKLSREKKNAIEDYKTTKIDEAYHRKMMEFCQSKIKILEYYLQINKGVKR